MESEGRRRAEADGQSGSDSDDELILKPDGGNGRPARAQPRRSEGPGPWDSTSGLVGNHDAAAVAGQQNAEFEQQLRDAAEGEPQQPPPQHLPESMSSCSAPAPSRPAPPYTPLATVSITRLRSVAETAAIETRKASSVWTPAVSPIRPAHQRTDRRRPPSPLADPTFSERCALHIAAPAPEIAHFADAEMLAGGQSAHGWSRTGRSGSRRTSASGASSSTRTRMSTSNRKRRLPTRRSWRRRPQLRVVFELAAGSLWASRTPKIARQPLFGSSRAASTL